MQLYHYTFEAMGTPCELQFYAASKAKIQAKKIAKCIINDVQRLEQCYSRYRSDSVLSKINRIAATGGRVQVDTETSALLDYAATCYLQSEGLFDITSGVLRQIWQTKQLQLPTQQQIAAILKNIGWQRIHWQSPWLEFPEQGLELDFGGIVKEYAVDRSAILLQESGIEHGYINLGGDIRVIGPHYNGQPWLIGIQHPRKPEKLLQTIELYNGALASSGDYQRCLIIEGQRYGHVFNPKSAWPVNYLAAVSVISDLCVVAGSAASIAMLKENEGIDWLDSLGLPCLWVDVHGGLGGKLLTTKQK